MTTALANGQLTLVAASERASPAPSRAHELERSIPLGDLERKPLTLLHDDTDEIVALAERTACALVGPSRVEARIEIVAKLLAEQYARHLALEAFLDERMLARDIEGVAMVDRALTNCTKRIAMLSREHAASCAVGRRDVVVAVAHADAIHVARSDK